MKTRKPIFAIAPLIILLLPLGMYLADSAISTGVIARNVTIAGVPVGGMSRTDATFAVEAHENRLRTDTGVFTVNDQIFKLSPITVGLRADIPEAITGAFAARRDAGVLTNFRSWIFSFSTTRVVPLTIEFDDSAVRDQIGVWESEAIPNPAFDGGVVVIEGEIRVEYPRPGRSLDHRAAYMLITAEMSTLDKEGVVLNVIDSVPVLTKTDVDEAALEIAQMIDTSITMVSSEVGFRTTFKPEQLAAAARVDISADGTKFLASFDADRVLEILEPRRTKYETQPLDAKFNIDLETDNFTIIPARSGTLLDIDRLLVEMKSAALGAGIGAFPLLIGTPPAFSTEDARAFTSLSPLAGFTTSYPASQPRVTNIHIMADEVNGAIVPPGEVWSLNDHIGERTEAKGYVAGPAIIDGEPYCCDHPTNIGGGVSQFATTLFNAVFYSCLQDEGHRPHSLYFTRYPMGREATLGIPSPDVRFKNNTEHPVVIATGYTATTITVKMYGDNGGMTCTDVTHLPEEIVEFTEELVADEEGVLEPGEREHIRSGINGFLIKVDRVVTYPDGRTETDMKLVHRYQPLTEQHLVHPCEVTGEPVNCPVELGSLINLKWADALAQLADLGLFAAKHTGFVIDPEKDNIVLTQNPAPGAWVEAGSTVTLTVGVYDG